MTQPRLPCFKLALALETPSITKTFLESGRTGFYLRVLQEGIIEAGDPIYPLPSREPVKSDDCRIRGALSSQARDPGANQETPESCGASRGVEKPAQAGMTVRRSALAKLR